jgi:hypothetical protein
VRLKIHSVFANNFSFLLRISQFLLRISKYLLRISQHPVSKEDLRIDGPAWTGQDLRELLKMDLRGPAKVIDMMILTISISSFEKLCNIKY